MAVPMAGRAQPRGFSAEGLLQHRQAQSLQRTCAASARNPSTRKTRARALRPRLPCSARLAGSPAGSAVPLSRQTMPQCRRRLPPALHLSALLLRMLGRRQHLSKLASVKGGRPPRSRQSFRMGGPQARAAGSP